MLVPSALIQTLLVRLPFAYVMSIQPNASLTKIGLAAPVSTTVGVIMNVIFFIYMNRKKGTVIFLQMKNAKQKSRFSCQMEAGMLHFQQKIKGMRFSLSNKIT